MTDLISTPLALPKIEPTNWDEWWALWNNNAKLIRKVKKTHNGSGVFWKGFHIYKADGVSSDHIGYQSEFVDCRHILPAVYENIDKLPINVEYIQVVSSLTVVPPHTDFITNELSVRTLLFDNNPTATFYYEINGKRIYQTLPKVTNTWAYWDHKTRHGTDFDFKNFKILIMYCGTLKEQFDLTPHVEMYQDYTINYKGQ